MEIDATALRRLPALREEAGRKIDSVPQIADLIDDKAMQIK
jgi:hypothetical protein